MMPLASSTSRPIHSIDTSIDAGIEVVARSIQHEDGMADRRSSSVGGLPAAGRQAVFLEVGNGTSGRVINLKSTQHSARVPNVNLGCRQWVDSPQFSLKLFEAALGLHTVR